ncbi:MAG: efflux RND transporter periplasmic adaptor subunit [Alphaproteobacteria bacterium]|nr:efflux RND transporter periplasmic adaptor subunit [Alphaproteobacteria bacterium]MBT4017274.1 efflux RND transporter periplasmic adaptor subunit [Alphaproteobacteria bacterium]MBT4964571.1 efflux RND transporter periplasmic adaptor subunit [Alphaproteobacteria bacterium]MBT5159030.1 efflux RND transporter periplasmic adaptor subunit [Alphaproteobacteria bacterium]MBT5918044.1 efflux RND transporter periplasmic adaptor subunit [Alphaproteobacteria bacterium]
MKLPGQLLVVAIIGGIGLVGWNYRQDIPLVSAFFEQGNSKKHRRGGRAVFVETKKARADTVLISVDAIGTAKSNESIIVTTQVTGMVSKIHFREGQWIKKGSPLVDLDAGELDGELAEKIALRDTAKRTYLRTQKLAGKKNVPAARVEELYGALMAAEARVRSDAAKLAEYKVMAPFSGRLGLRRISLGALVRPGDQITTLDDTSRLKVDFRIPETAISHISIKQVVTANSAAWPDQDYVGRVQTIDSRVDPTTRSVEIRAIFDNKQGKLKPGMFLTATLTAAVRDNAILIPEQALVSSSDKQFVFTVAEGKAVKTIVTTGEHINGDIEILSGVAVGTPVIVGGVQKVRPGQAVKEMPPGGFKGDKPAKGKKTGDKPDGKKPAAAKKAS